MSGAPYSGVDSILIKVCDLVQVVELLQQDAAAAAAAATADDGVDEAALSEELQNTGDF
jgi:hypothetical protein